MAVKALKRFGGSSKASTLASSMLHSAHGNTQNNFTDVLDTLGGAINTMSAISIENNNLDFNVEDERERDSNHKLQGKESNSSGTPPFESRKSE